MTKFLGPRSEWVIGLVMGLLIASAIFAILAYEEARGLEPTLLEEQSDEWVNGIDIALTFAPQCGNNAVLVETIAALDRASQTYQPIEHIWGCVAFDNFEPVLPEAPE